MADATGGLGGGAPWMSFFNSNPGAGIGMAAGLGAGALLGGLLPQPQLPYQGNLTGIAKTAGQQASQLGAEGQQFLQPALGAPLPPALEAQVQQTTNDAIANIKSQYASLGLSKSTMTADEEAYIGLQAEALRGKLATEMASIGTSLTQQSTQNLSVESSVYQNLMQAQISADNAQQQSFSQFMGALGMVAAVALV